MRSYFKINGAQLSRQVGTDSESGMRISDGREGHLCHGPYISLPTGRYTAAFFVRRQNPLLAGTITMDVCARHGDIILAKGHVQSDEIFHDVASFLKLDFDSSEDLDNVEVRMFVEGGMLIEVSELVIYRRTAREWGVQ